MQNNAVPPQGGLTTDGQKVDPVSGNEVPLGSNAQEVRDDLPAQLSEGEYVVPSDIVRYYGVKFFEDLRDQGKGGLNNMAANGRIGGQPMPQGGPQANDITPEEMQQMQGMTQGYSIGGFNTEESITTPSRYTGAFSWETPDPEETGGGTGGDEGSQVTLYCPDGSVNVLQLPADQDRYDELTQQGCGVDAAIAQPQKSDDPGVKDMPKADPTGWMKDYGYVKWEDRNNEENGGKTESWDDIWQASMDALEEKDQNLIERLLSGGVFGKIQQATVASEVAGNWAVLNANAQTQEEIDKAKELQEAWLKYTKEKGLDLLPDEIINGDQRAKQVNSTQVDWALSMDDVDIYGKPLFDSEEEFIKQMEETASDKDKGITATYIKPGATYTDSTTGEQKTNTGEGFLQMDYDDKKSGYLSTIKPKLRPTTIKPIDGNQDEPDDDEGPEVTLLPNELTDDDMGLPSEPVDFSQFETETASAPNNDMTMAEQYASYGQGKAGEVDDGSYQVATSDPTAAFDKFIEDTSQPLEITTYTGQPQKDDDDPNTIFKPVEDTGGYDEAPVTYTPPADDDDPTPAFTYTAPASDPYAEPGRPTSSKKDDDPNSIFNKPTTTTTSSAPSYTKPANDPYAEDRGGRSSSSSSSSASSSKGGGCVIATHAVASGSFQWSDKENAMEWCKKTLHDKWWGETMRRGYRYLGRKHIANGTAETIYKEFKECIEWANGKRPFKTKIAARYYYRAIQTFFVGLFVK